MFLQDSTDVFEEKRKKVKPGMETLIFLVVSHKWRSLQWPHNINVALGNGGGDQVQIGPSPFTSVMGQASVGLANGEHNQKYLSTQSQYLCKVYS